MLKKAVGISVYPDYYGIEDCKKQLDQAHELGYTHIFTGFSEAIPCINDTFRFIFQYAYQLGMIAHVDINDTVLQALHVTPNDLSALHDLHIPILRADCGIDEEAIVTMTKNPYGIKIEENLSNYRTLEKRMKMIQAHGNMQNYGACHNFYPRVNSGLSLAYVIECATLAQQYGCQCGAFIGSLYSKSDLNPIGKSIMSVETHREIPAHIQAMELFSSEQFDFLIFGDSAPSLSELKAVAKTTRSAYDCLETTQKKALTPTQIVEYQETYCVQIPVYFETFINENQDMLENLILRNRIDVPSQVLRLMNLRHQWKITPYNTIRRDAFSITVDNTITPSYTGELEIMLEALPAVSYANVIGIVKPIGHTLVKIVQSGHVMFQMTSN